MSEKILGAAEGAKLWDRARTPWRDAAGTPAPPDALTLAAYLDGNLDENSAGAVEAWMAMTPEGMDDIQAIRGGLAETPAAAPAHVVARAQAILRAPAIPAAGGPGWWSRIFAASSGRMAPTIWAGAAAAVLLASVSGFELGRAGVEHLVSLDATVAHDVRLVMGRAGQDLL